MLGESASPEVRLQRLRDLLNAVKGTERGEEIVRLVAMWMKAPSLDALLRRDPVLHVNLNHAAATPQFYASKREKRGIYRVIPDRPRDDSSRSFAIWLFAHLVTNPLCERLAGPCARCGNYFIKRRTSQTVYCSRRCGNAATARARTRARNESERKEKLLRVQAALREWRAANMQGDWKRWVAQRSRADLRFITRAVHKGEVKAPQKGR